MSINVNAYLNIILHHTLTHNFHFSLECRACSLSVAQGTTQRYNERNRNGQAACHHQPVVFSMGKMSAL